MFVVLNQSVLKIILVGAFSSFSMFMLLKNIHITEISESVFVGYAIIATIVFWVCFFL